MEEESSISVYYEGIETPVWAKSYQSFVGGLLSYLEINCYELSIVFCQNPFIKELNRLYRDKDEPTDVLSFPYSSHSIAFNGSSTSSQILQGDIFISLDELSQNSCYFQVEENEELKRLSIHAILHLMGWDHKTNDPKEEMLVYQEKILLHFQGEVLF